MIDNLIGADEIIESLLHQGKSPNEKRSLDERYNLIIQAIYGENADPFLRKRKRGRPINNREDTVIDVVLVDMYEARSLYESRFQLADAFVDRIMFQGTRENAIKELARKFSQRMHEFEDQSIIERIRDDAKIFGAQKGYMDEYFEMLKEIVEVLSRCGWEIKIS